MQKRMICTRTLVLGGLIMASLVALPSAGLAGDCCKDKGGCSKDKNSTKTAELSISAQVPMSIQLPAKTLALSVAATNKS